MQNCYLFTGIFFPITSSKSDSVLLIFKTMTHILTFTTAESSETWIAKTMPSDMMACTIAIQALWTWLRAVVSKESRWTYWNEEK